MSRGNSVLMEEDADDLADLMAGMFGDVAVAVDGEAQGSVAAVVASRRVRAQGTAARCSPLEPLPVGRYLHYLPRCCGAQVTLVH